MKTLCCAIISSLLLANFAAAGQPEPKPNDHDLFSTPEKEARRVRSFLKVAPGAANVVPQAGARIDWQPWNSESFAAAARGDKMIFVFITAPWSARGAQMEAGALRDAEIIAQLNKHTVAIRLERDERPDVDLRLQEAVHALAGVRGWPLCVFMTASGGVIFGGTFFEASDDPATGEYGLRSVLRYLVRLNQDDPQLPLRQAAVIDTELSKLSAPEPADVTAATLDAYAAACLAQADRKAGGFLTGGSAKFPTPAALEFLLLRHARGDTNALSAATLTTEQMLRGGIYDQLAGGFHRHTIDRWWRVPLFEKFLIENAELLRAAAQVWQITRSPALRDAIVQTLNFWQQQRTPDGSFFAHAIGPDAGQLPAAYYGWSVKDIELLFSDAAERQFAAALYDIAESGELETTAPDRNVLFRALSTEQLAAQFKIPVAEVPPRVARVTQVLREARALRPQPQRDLRVYSAGNALFAAALIECGRTLGEKRFVQQGLKTLRQLSAEGIERDGPASFKGVQHELRHEAKGRRPSNAFDEAALCFASTLAFEASGDDQLLREAIAALQRLQELYWDKERGGYFDRRNIELGEPAGTWRRKIYADTFEPSANGLAALSATRLAVLLNDAKYAEHAQAIVKSAGKLERLGPFGANLASAADAALHGGTQIIVVGQGESSTALLQMANATYSPHKIVQHVETHADLKAGALVIRGAQREIATDAETLQKLLALRAR